MTTQAGSSTRTRRVQSEWQRGATRPLTIMTLILALTFVLTACGGGATPTTAPAASTAPSTAASTAPSTAPAASAAASTAPASTAPASSTAPAGGAATRTTAAGATTTAAGSAGSTATRPSGTATGSATPVGTAGANATPNNTIKIAGKQGDAAALNGAGATFPQVLYSKWFAEYNTATGVQVNYQGTGSGAGKNAIRDQTVDFAGSDSPMSDAELAASQAKCGGTILHIPTTLGAIVVAYNLPNLSQKVKLDGDTIAGIFLEKITKWNDPKIAALNPGVTLPNEDIITIHRSDSSGTTDNFTSYLAAVNQEWANGPKSGSTVQWPGGIGASGNPGVASEIKNNPYAIGYVELAFAKQNNLPYADVKNREGQFVTASAASVTAAGQAFAPQAPADLRFKLVNAPGAQSYPITAITWILACPNQTDQPKAIALTRMLWWALHEGQQFNEGLDYAPLPPSIVVRGEAFINSIVVNGQKAFPGK
ncbi:MAG TPA: phosphate ABC transporter substrate-binding protein PstS [Thermomicrobiales bacterium]